MFKVYTILKKKHGYGEEKNILLEYFTNKAYEISLYPKY